MASEPAKSISQRAVEAKLQSERHGPKKNLAEWMLKNICQLTDDTLEGADKLSGGIDQYSKETIKRTTAAYYAFSEPFNKGVDGAVNSINSVSSKFQEGLEDVSQAITESLSKALKPVPLGSAVDTATALLKDPLGAPQFLANTLTSVVDKISPNFTNQLDSAFKSVNVEGLQHLPSKMMGSIRNLTMAADAILSVPFEIMSDLYNGLLKILNSIADMIDGFISGILDFLIGPKGLLDGIFPISELMSFFDQLGQLASMVGGLSQTFGGFEMVTNITNQVSNFSSQATSALSDPLQLISSYAPQLQQGMGFVSDFTGALRNPEQALQKFLPPEIGNQMKKISQIPGLGFMGNNGFSVGDTLDNLSEGFFTKALDDFADQIPILGPLFNKSGGAASVPLTDPVAQGPTEFAQSTINPAQEVGNGGVVQLEDTSGYQVFSETHIQQAKDKLRFGGMMSSSSLPSFRV